MRKMSKKWKRCVAALLACCMVFSATSVSTVFEGILEQLSVEGVDFIYDGPAVELGDTILYNDEMERISTTVLFKHWHLTRVRENGEWVTDTIEVPEEYRFYQAEADKSVIHLYKRVNKTDQYFTLEKIFYIDLTAEKPYENVYVEIYPQGTYNARVPEKFSNFSISSGHDSIVQEAYTYTDADGNVVNSTKIKAYYSPPESNIENHLIKGHAFYVSELELKVGVDFSQAGEFLNAAQTVKNPYWNGDTVIYTGEFDTAIGPDGTVYYDTSAGLHTDKTAYVTEDSTDGRTFDLELKAWYAGEDVADVGFVLDASGSMAWTTNVIEPLQIDPAIVAKYQIPTGQVLSSDMVNAILNNANTDNTRLSYTEYNYYIYDKRDTVSEFVPLGYWCGDVNTSVSSLGYDLIGYYPFEGSLDNAVDDNAETKATFIKHAEDNGGVFDKNATPNASYQYPEYTNGALNLKTTAQNGAVVLDVVPNVTSTSQTFSVSFEVAVGNTGKEDSDPFDETPIMYIGNASSTSYYRIVRGNKRPQTSRTAAGAAGKIRFYDNDTTQPSTVNGSSSGESGVASRKIDYSIFNTDADKNTFYKCTFSFSDNSVKFFTSGTVSGSGNVDSNTLDHILTYSADDPIQIIIAGNNCEGKEAYSDVYVRNVQVYSTALKGLDADQDDVLIGSYSLTNNEDGLVNQVKAEQNVTENAAAKFIKQFAGSFDLESEGNKGNITEAKVEFTGTSYKGDQALNLTATSRTGAVLLDAVPNSKSYTISFAIKNSDTSDYQKFSNQAELMYMGSLSKSTPYYGFVRTAKPNNVGSDDRHIRLTQNGSTKSSVNYVFDNGTDKDDWKVITYVVENGTTVHMYKKGGYMTADGKSASSNPPESVDTTITEFTGDALNIILAGLKDEYNGSPIYIDELYVFNEALDGDGVKKLYDAIGSDPDTPAYKNSRNYIPAYDEMGNVISALTYSQFENLKHDEREGWYYVNSHSDWPTLNDEKIGTGKNYLANLTVKTNNKGEITEYLTDLVLTKPNAYIEDAVFDSIYAAATTGYDYSYSMDKNFGANKFFLIQAPGSTIKEDENGKRYLEATGETAYYLVSTFYNGDTNCRSLVYYKPDRERTKVESLQFVLNTFTNNLENEAPRSRVSAVRFSMEPRESNKLPAGEFDLSSTGALKKGTYAKKSGTFTDDQKKYYTDEDTELDHLVLLDWMKKSTSVGIVSARRAGIDTTVGKDQSNPNINDENNTLTEGYDPYDPIDQYNYFLTGGTYTWTGLKAFYTQLASRRERYLNGNQIIDPTKRAHKYVILFTDGKDNLMVAKPIYGENNEITGYTYEASSSAGNRGSVTSAREWAELLKEEGYSIFCVMLASGAVAEGTADYEGCVAYLTDIAGPHTNYYGEYPDVKDYVFTPTDDKSLSRDFNTILERINSQLDDYTVQDTIDPRFDLIEEYVDQTDAQNPVNINHVIELGAGGALSIRDAIEGDLTQIVVYDPDGKVVDGCKSVNNERYYLFTALDGKEAKLYYSSENDMYYLQWVEELIPGCAENADELEIWESRIRIRAKVDFIGGNSILTNGNAANMNYVFDPAESDANTSSGTNKANPKQDGDAYARAGNRNPYNPSKGFPRTTVNVRLYNLNAGTLYGELYMGEAVTPAQLLSNVENKYVTDSYYLDYIKRYAYQRYQVNGSTSSQANMPIIDLLNQWLKIDDISAAEKSFSIPYIYLPKVEYDDTGQLVKNGDKVAVFNNSGNAASKEDVVGILTYTWKKLEPKDESNQVIDSTVWEYITTDTERIVYALSVEYTPFREGDTEADLASKIKGGLIYIDDTKHKPAIEYDRILENNADKKESPDGSGRYISADNGLIREMQEPYGGSAQKWDVYRWNPVYKPVPQKAKTQQPEADRQYGTAVISDDGRTLKASANYALDIVSGDLALELKVPVQDLKAVAIGEDDTGTGYSATFKMKATRRFVDTAYIQGLIADDKIDHYDDDFILTFEFNYTKDEVEELISGKDSEEYVNLFAKATKAEATWNIANSSETEKIELVDHLPIGTYTFDVNTTFVEDSATNFNNQNFIYMVDETDKSKFKTEYFNDIVLRGLFTSNEKAYKENDRKDDSDNLIFVEPDITDDNIQSYVANSKSTKSNHGASSGTEQPGIEGAAENNQTSATGKKVAIFYLGTDSADKRGVVDRESYPDESCYIDDRLGIIVLSIGNTDMKITKKVENTTAEEDLNQLWTFKITLTSDMGLNNLSDIPLLYKDADGNDVTTEYEKQTVTFSSPVDQNTPVSYVYTAEIELKHGHSVTIKGIGSGEENISYTVEELQNDNYNLGDYEAGFIDQSGKLGPDTWVRCVNTFTSMDLPDLGGMGTETQKNYGYLFVILSMLISGYMISYRIRQMRTRKR